MPLHLRLSCPYACDSPTPTPATVLPLHLRLTYPYAYDSLTRTPVILLPLHLRLTCPYAAKRSPSGLHGEEPGPSRPWARPCPLTLTPHSSNFPLACPLIMRYTVSRLAEVPLDGSRNCVSCFEWKLAISRME